MRKLHILHLHKTFSSIFQFETEFTRKFDWNRKGQRKISIQFADGKREMEKEEVSAKDGIIFLLVFWRKINCWKYFYIQSSLSISVSQFLRDTPQYTRLYTHLHI